MSSAHSSRTPCPGSREAPSARYHRPRWLTTERRRPRAPGFDAVLATPRPTFQPAEAAAIAARTFGVAAVDARDLGSERDQTFLLLDGDGAGLAICKLSNTAEDPAVLDMEAAAVLHARRVDPGLPLAVPWLVLGATDDGPASRRAPVEGPSGIHHVRGYDLLPGRQRSDPRDLSDAALVAWGETTARLGRALRGFADPALLRTMLWDIQHAARTRQLVPAIRDAGQRALVERVLDRYEAVVVPAWPGLRAQAVHTDLTTDNALVDDAGRISGIVDFGDMAHSALLVDLAGALDSVLDDRARGRDLPGGPARASTATSGTRRSSRSSCGCSASASRRGPR